MTSKIDSAGPARIGIIGLGRMGSAMAARLSGQGCRVDGWTRSGVDASRAERLNIEPCRDVASLAAQSELIVLSLLDDAAVVAILEELCRQDLAGRLIVDTSTVSPDTLRDRLGDIRAAGGSALDAPISGGPDMVENGMAGLYIGGRDDDVARFMPVARLLSNRILHVGSVGAGSAAKVVNNMMLAGFWQTLKEATQVGIRSGLSIETMTEILSESPAANAALSQRMPIILGQSDAVGFSVSGIVKDIALFVETARKLGVPAPTMAAALESFSSHRDGGHGHDDLATMVRAALSGTVC